MDNSSHAFLRKIKWIGLLSVSVCFCLFMLMFIGYQLTGTVGRVEKISEREAYLLLRELIHTNNEYEANLKNEEEENIVQNSMDEIIGDKDRGVSCETLSAYLEVCSKHDEKLQQLLEQQAGAVAQGLKKLKEKYGDKKDISKEDWYAFYDLTGACLNSDYGTENGIHQVPMVILKKINTKQYVTNAGMFRVVDETMDISAFSSSVMMVNKDKLLTVKEEYSDKVNVTDIWIKSVSDEQVTCFYEGEEFTVPVKKELYEELTNHQKKGTMLSKVTDIEMQDGKAVSVQDKELLHRDRVITIDDQKLVLENQGIYSLSENMKIYVSYGGVTKGNLSDIFIGYDYTEFAMDTESRQITAAIVFRNDNMKNVRVLIKGKHYEGLVHDRVHFALDGSYTLRRKNVENGDIIREERYADTQIIFVHDSEYQTMDNANEEEEENRTKNRETQNDDRKSNGMQNIFFIGNQEELILIPENQDARIRFLELGRNQGEPLYRGGIYCIGTKDGIAVVNEVLLEDYLYAVVPSEMPSSYPLEALKAQAVCARTYAYGKMQNALYPSYGAHMDDSTTCQVYQNIAEQASTNEAVDETFGEVLCNRNGVPVDVFYYATSCGYGTTEEIWGNGKKYEYLHAQPIEWERKDKNEIVTVDDMRDNAMVEQYLSTTDAGDIEYREPWYRWKINMQKLDARDMSSRVQTLYGKYPDKILTWEETATQYMQKEIPMWDEVQDLEIVNRLQGGVADQLLIEADHQKYLICGEQNIRMVLSQKGEQIIRQDGTVVDTSTLLPSSFISISYQDKKLNIQGGGYGHGVGMSQNGAAAMAENGKTEEEILNFFFEDIAITCLY